MNIGLVISCMRSGGAERVMSQLANHWAERGDAVTLITLDAAENDCYALHPRIRRVALHLLGDSGGAIAGLLNSVRRIVALRKALRASGAAVVLAFEDRTNVLVLVATAWMPLRRVVAERNNPQQNRVGRMWDLLRRMTYPLADSVVVQTAALLPWARQITFSRRQVEAIANPVRDMKAYVRTGGSASNHTIIAVGRLAPQKGFDVLLRAFAQIANALPSWNLTIVGRGEERERLTELASSLGIAERVAFPGWLPEPGELLAEASLFVMPSHYEGFPNALLEAMACGLPVITTRWPGLGDIVTDGVDGLEVPVGSADDLAHAMQCLISDAGMRARLGRNALAVCDRYELSTIVKAWDAVLATPC